MGATYATSEDNRDVVERLEGRIRLYDEYVTRHLGKGRPQGQPLTDDERAEMRRLADEMASASAALRRAMERRLKELSLPIGG